MRNRQGCVFCRALACLIILVLALGITGCNTGAKLDNKGGGGGSFPLTLTDDMGRQVTLPAEPVRIVSLAPSNTEILFFLGLGSRVVGDTTYCDYPAEAKNVTKIGGFMDPSLEQVVALKPDLVLATDMHQSIIKNMEDAGLKVLVLNPNTLEEIFDSIVLVGKAAGVENQAVDLTQGLKERVQAVSQKVADISDNQRPTVFYEMWYEPLMSIGKDNLIGQMIQIAGGTNITGDIPEQYPQVSEELIIARNPQVMIISYGHENQEISPAQIAARRGWQNIAFVQSNRIYTIDTDLLTLPGPRIVDGLEQMAACLHPELFKQ
jgi:iron complex transport system substrate-binding protein